MFEWSSPTRRIGNRVLDSIPLEIYQEIFEYLCESDNLSAKELRRILANMTLVCRFFSAIALPKLFAKMTFSGGQGSEVSRTNRFCRALNNNQEPARTLAKHVKACTFTSWRYHSPTDALDRPRDAFFTMYCIALSKMTSVESITFNSVSIDKRILKSVKKLCLIKSLSFSQCSLAPGVDLDQFKEFLQALRLRCLVTFQWELPQAQTLYNTISPSFQLHDLIRLETDSWTIIQRLSELNLLLPLQTLTIHDVEDPTLLPTLFRKTPHLLHLHIYIIRSRVDVLTSVQFADGLLPKLSSFDGPPSLAILLIPSRPVRKIWLMGALVVRIGSGSIYSPPLLPPLTQRVWEALSKSKASVEELLMPEHLYYAASLRSYLPNVATVMLSWCHSNWDFMIPVSETSIKKAVLEMCTRWPPNPSISRLVFEFTLAGAKDCVLLNLQSQYEILQELIVVAFPNVEHVNFVTCINWRRTSGEGKWRPEIPKAKKRHIWTLWKDEQYQLVDYGGCFEALFDSSSPDFRDYTEV